MADARRARAERRATRIAQTAPVGPAGAPRSPSPMVNAATGPDAQEQQGSSQPVTEHPDDRTATPPLVRASGSASNARSEVSQGRRMLAMATELLFYRPPWTATTTRSSASRSSSPLPATPQRSPVRFDSNSPKQTTRNKMPHPHHCGVTCAPSPSRKRVPVADLAIPRRGQETKRAVR
ncbi:hypothetical protein D1007_55462 [Hordeum vulgare]|nr:hypothetical protein D1007_55462 [Hordeum vulgare]